MLRMASFPPDREVMGRWFADHQQEWRAGTAYRFAVELQERMIGLVDIDSISEGQGTLGYWLDRAAWGHGFAFEAARAATDFASVNLGLKCLMAGHAEDNPASGRILTKLGFRYLDAVERFSSPRGENIRQLYRLPLMQANSGDYTGS